MNNLSQVGFLYLLAFFVSFVHYADSDDMGPFNGFFRETGECEEQGNGDIKFLNPKLAKVGRNEIQLTTTIVLKIPVGHDIALTIDVDVWGNGGWKKNFFLFENEDFFDWLTTTLPDLYVALLNQTNTKELPILPGSYDVQLPMSNVKVTNIPEVPYGKYAVDINFFKDKNLAGCVPFKVDIVPKRTKKGKKKRN